MCNFKQWHKTEYMKIQSFEKCLFDSGMQVTVSFPLTLLEEK